MASSPMRVIYLSNSIGSKRNGGSGLSGLRFLELLVKRYKSVHFITDALRNVPTNIPGVKVSIISCEPPRFKANFRLFVRSILVNLLNLFRPTSISIDAQGRDLLVVCNSFYDIFPRILIHNVRSIFTVCVVRGDINSFAYQRFGSELSQDPLSEPLAFLRRFSSLIFVSSTTKTNWESLLNIPRKGFLLPNAIQEDEVNLLLASHRQEIRTRLGWDENAIHVIVLGSIQKRKGQDIFVDAAVQISSLLPNVRIHFVGVISKSFGGDEIARALRSADPTRYKLYGHRDDALSFVHAADIAVMVSHSEAFPRTVAEYMALGKPIVTTPVAGSDEMVTDGYNGFVIPPSDSVALVEALLRLSQDSTLRDKFGSLSQDRYKNRYSMSSQSLQFNQIFDSIEKEVARNVN